MAESSISHDIPIKNNDSKRSDSQETIKNINNELKERVGENNPSDQNTKERPTKDVSSSQSRRDTKAESRHEREERKKSNDRHRRRKKSRSRSSSRSSRSRREKRRRRSRSRDRKYHHRDSRSKYRRRSRSSRRRSTSSDSERVKNRPAKVRNYREERRMNREQSRSNSALRIMKLKNLANSCGYYQRFYERPHEDGDPNKPQLYWDGFQWVIKPNSLSTQTFDVIKPGRKVQIANIPLHLNISAIDLKNYLVKVVEEKGIITNKHVSNINNIIRGLEIDFDKNSAVIAMESTDLAKRMALLDGSTLLGHTLRFSAYQDIDGDTTSSAIAKSSALANSAQLSAKSSAIAFAAFKSITKSDNNVSINLSNSNKLAITRSKIVKVMNLVDPDAAIKFKPEKFDELERDIKAELKRFGEIMTILVIKPNLVKIGAESGSAFVEYAELSGAENAINGLRGRRYMGREIKATFLDEEAFKQEILEDK